MVRKRLKRMGVHDYVCFVQRNGQCLNQYELLSKPMTIIEEVSDYIEALSSSDTELESCVWKSPDRAEWLVNFDPLAYKIFVEGSIDPLLVPLEYYNCVLQNRELDLPTKFSSLSKQEIFD